MLFSTHTHNTHLRMFCFGVSSVFRRKTIKHILWSEKKLLCVVYLIEHINTSIFWFLFFLYKENDVLNHHHPILSLSNAVRVFCMNEETRKKNSMSAWFVCMAINDKRILSFCLMHVFFCFWFVFFFGFWFSAMVKITKRKKNEKKMIMYVSVWQKWMYYVSVCLCLVCWWLKKQLFRWIFVVVVCC